MESIVTIESVETVQTRGGNVRYVIRDADGGEYTTFREAIGGRAAECEGRRARIQYHEEKRGQYTNVYLDSVEPVPGGAPAEAAPGGAPAEAAPGGAAAEAGRGAAPAEPDPDTDPEEAAWRTAVDAAPWLLGEADPHAKTSPEELYETLKPFKDRVAEDIKESE